MKNFKRLLAFLLAVLMIFSLCACGKSSGGESKNDENKLDPDKIDLGGHEITIASWWDDLPKQDSTDEAHKLRYARMKELAKQLLLSRPKLLQTCVQTFYQVTYLQT